MTVGSLSFAACYRHGPLAKARSQRLLAWALRLLALALTHSGAPLPQVAWAAVGLLLLPRGLRCPARAFRYVTGVFFLPCGLTLGLWFHGWFGGIWT